jgi:hypothetical protein
MNSFTFDKISLCQDIEKYVELWNSFIFEFIYEFII